MTTEIFGLNINYEEMGEGDLVLILHGWASNVGLHKNMAELLSKKYKVVMPDFPGMGQSQEPLEPWNVDKYVDFTLEFLKLYNPKKLIVLGHSFGGRVIIKMCSRELPFEIDKVVLFDAAGVKPVKSASRKAIEKVGGLAKKFFSSKFGRLYYPDAYENLQKLLGSEDYNAASATMKETLKLVVNEDLCHLMPNVKAETLLIWGRLDDATPLSDGQKMNELMPNSGLVVFENCGHFAFLENQQQFNNVISSFLL